MSETIMIALISLVGNIAGSVCSIIIANKLISYRVDKLEEKINILNTHEERLYRLESTNELQNQKIQNTNDIVHEIKTRLESISERIPANA